jgi:hypothetical protein
MDGFDRTRGRDWEDGGAPSKRQVPHKEQIEVIADTLHGLNQEHGALMKEVHAHENEKIKLEAVIVDLNQRLEHLNQRLEQLNQTIIHMTREKQTLQDAEPLKIVSECIKSFPTHHREEENRLYNVMKTLAKSMLDHMEEHLGELIYVQMGHREEWVVCCFNQSISKSSPLKLMACAVKRGVSGRWVNMKNYGGEFPVVELPNGHLEVGSLLVNVKKLPQFQLIITDGGKLMGFTQIKNGRGQNNSLVPSYRDL